MKPRRVSNLIDIVGEEKISDAGEEFSNFMESLHKEVKLRIEQSNQKYKENAYQSRRHHDFQVGDEVMAHLKKFGPCNS